MLSSVLPRFSPQGDRLAFYEGVRVSGARSSGTLWMVDQPGNKTRLFSGTLDVDDGLAWSPRGDELWFVSRPETARQLLRAVDRAGKVRDMQTFDGWVGLKDIAPNGDVLLSRVLFHKGIVVIDRDGKEQDLTWLNRSGIADISEDGKTIVFTERIREEPFVCVRRRDAPDAVRLGEGEAKALSPDGSGCSASRRRPSSSTRWGRPAAGPAPDRSRAALRHPLGALLPRRQADPRLRQVPRPVRGSTRSTSRPARLEPLSPEDQIVGTSMTHPFSPDARRLLVRPDDRALRDLHAGGGSFEDIGLSLDDVPIRWSSDGRYVFYRAMTDQRRSIGWISRAAARSCGRSCCASTP